MDRAGKSVHQSLGQHYLVNANAVISIAAACRKAAPDSLAIEIGAGLGVLTHALLEEGLAVRAVEIEAASADILEETLGKAHRDRLVVLRGDFLGMDLSRLTGGSDKRFLVCGNLPYNRVTEILLKTVELFRESLPAMVFMMQREVAQKLMAAPGKREYGVMSVLLQALFTLKPVMNLAPGSFHPPPKIDSTVLSFFPVRGLRDFPSWPLFTRVVRAAFSHRRKKISGALRDSDLLTPLETQKVVAAHPDLVEKRAENLGWTEYQRLASGLE
jgi:16S rRNA (adenine1518-N6/adenine1519-N6)-dimethyltransferase